MTRRHQIKLEQQQIPTQVVHHDYEDQVSHHHRCCPSDARHLRLRQCELFTRPSRLIPLVNRLLHRPSRRQLFAVAPLSPCISAVIRAFESAVGEIQIRSLSTEFKLYILKIFVNYMMR